MVLFAVPVVMLDTLMAEPVVNVACFPFNAVRTLVPCTVSDPDIVVLPVTANVVFSIQAPCARSSRVATTSRPCKSPEAVTLATDSAEVALTTALAPSEMSCMISTLFRYSGPAITALDPQVMLPLLSTDGALTAQLNVALLLVIPSLSVPPESPKRSV